MKLKIGLILLFAIFLSYPAFCQKTPLDSLFFEAKKHNSDLDTLISIYSQFILLNPNSFEAVYERGRVHYLIWLKSQKEDGPAFRKAMEDFNSAILINEKYHPAFFIRSILYFNKNELEQAFSDISTAIRLDNLHHYYYARRGHMYKEIENYSLAEANFEMAIKIVGKKYYNPNKAEILAGLNRDKAFCLAKLKRYKKAIRTVNNAINFGGLYDYRSFLCKGNIYAEMGEYKKALKLYTYIIERTNNFMPAYLHRGKVYYAMEEKEKAIADWEKMVRGGYDIDLKKTTIRPGF